MPSSGFSSLGDRVLDMPGKGEKERERDRESEGYRLWVGSLDLGWVFWEEVYEACSAWGRCCSCGTWFQLFFKRKNSSPGFVCPPVLGAGVGLGAGGWTSRSWGWVTRGWELVGQPRVWRVGGWGREDEGTGFLELRWRGPREPPLPGAGAEVAGAALV